jgi:alkylhydroperoxidase/carboxymuconolactone decarboxylase family protein YurZ
VTNVDYTERLRRLAINDATVVASEHGLRNVELQKIDEKTLALVRLAAITAVGGAVPSFGEEADAATASGATADEMVDVLVALVPVLGLPCVVAAAPKLALALGHDVESTL